MTFYDQNFAFRKFQGLGKELNNGFVRFPFGRRGTYPNSNRFVFNGNFVLRGLWLNGNSYVRRHPIAYFPPLPIFGFTRLMFAIAVGSPGKCFSSNSQMRTASLYFFNRS